MSLFGYKADHWFVEDQRKLRRFIRDLDLDDTDRYPDAIMFVAKDWELRWVFDTLTNELVEEIIFDIACQQMAMIFYDDEVAQKLRDWLVNRAAHILYYQMFYPGRPLSWGEYRMTWRQLPFWDTEIYPYPQKTDMKTISWLTPDHNPKAKNLAQRYSWETKPHFIREVLYKYVSDRAERQLWVWEKDDSEFGRHIRLRKELLEEFRKWDGLEDYYAYLERKYDQYCTELVSVLRMFVITETNWKANCELDRTLRKNVNRLVNYLYQNNGNRIPNNCRKIGRQRIA